MPFCSTTDFSQFHPGKICSNSVQPLNWTLGVLVVGGITVQL